MNKKYLLCPQCGIHRFYIKKNDEFLYFHISHEKEILSTRESGSEFAKTPDRFMCCGCSWIGSVRGLVKYFIF